MRLQVASNYGLGEGYRAEGLFCRDIGAGIPLIILHGGPGFDHSYFLPEMDTLAGSFRLIYYDQRGRGRSAQNVRAEDVTLDSEMDDLDGIRRQFGLESAAVLGHSWGALLALEYAVRHPNRVSHLILMNPAPVSHEGYLMFRNDLSRLRTPEEEAELMRLSQSEDFAAGDLEIDAAYLRIHFRPAFRNPPYLERLIPRLRAHFTRDGIRIARAIGEGLCKETWLSQEYNLLPKLQNLQVPTLVLHGDSDFIPVEIAAQIAGAIPDARLVVLNDCGHFPFMERRDELFDVLGKFLRVRGRGTEPGRPDVI